MLLVKQTNKNTVYILVSLLDTVYKENVIIGLPFSSRAVCCAFTILYLVYKSLR